MKSGQIISNCYILQEELERNRYFIRYSAKALYSAARFYIDFLNCPIKQISAEGQDFILGLTKSVYNIQHSHLIVPFDIGLEGDQMYLTYNWYEGETLKKVLSQGQNITIQFSVNVFSRLLKALLVMERSSARHGSLTDEKVLVPKEGRVDGMARLTGVFERNLLPFFEGEKDTYETDWFSDEIKADETPSDVENRDIYSLTRILSLLLGKVGEDEKKSETYKELLQFSEGLFISPGERFSLIEIEEHFEEWIRAQRGIHIWNDDEITQRYSQMIGSDIRSEELIEFDDDEEEPLAVEELSEDDVDRYSLGTKERASSAVNGEFGNRADSSDKIAGTADELDREGDYSRWGGAFSLPGKPEKDNPDVNKGYRPAMSSRKEGVNPRSRKRSPSDRIKGEYRASRINESSRRFLEEKVEGQAREQERVNTVIDDLQRHYTGREGGEALNLSSPDGNMASSERGEFRKPASGETGQPIPNGDTDGASEAEYSDYREISRDERPYLKGGDGPAYSGSGIIKEAWNIEERELPKEAVSYDFKTSTGSGPDMLDGTKLDEGEKVSAPPSSGIANSREGDMSFPTGSDKPSESLERKSHNTVLPVRQETDYPRQKEAPPINLSQMSSAPTERKEVAREPLPEETVVEVPSKETSEEVLDAKAEWEENVPADVKKSPTSKSSPVEEVKPKGWRGLFNRVRKALDQVVSNFRRDR
ncbi:MAG: hypothetical protein PQJ59_00630 [Spirochaetales bacterium]|nr:hypothetical protein [Spirochaetales bacterium]